MSPFPGPFLPRSMSRALVVPWLRHARWWIRSPEYRAWLRFNRRLRNFPARTPGVVHHGGRRIRFLDAASFLSAWHDIFVVGFYRIPAPAGGVVPRMIDAGANIGLAALGWSQQFPRFDYLGFEPDPQAAAICRENLAAWSCPGSVQQAALGGRAGRRHFVSDQADGGHLVDGQSDRATMEVTVELLSEHLDRPVDLLKIDVEGAEYEIVSEIEPRLACVRNLFVEIHSRRGAPQEWGALVATLQRAGFRCFVRPALPPSLPFVEPSPGGPDFDEQINVFAVREAPETR